MLHSRLFASAAKLGQEVEMGELNITAPYLYHFFMDGLLLAFTVACLYGWWSNYRKAKLQQKEVRHRCL
jgi:hypothetical protein